MTSPRRRPSPQAIAVALLAVIQVALVSVLVPLHATLYDTTFPLAMLLGAAVCAAPLVAIRHPRIAIAVFSIAAVLLPLVVGPNWTPTAPWPWSVPALIAFAIFIAVSTFLHGWRNGLIPLLLCLAASLIAPLLVPEPATADAIGADLIVTASITAVVYLVAVLLAGRLRLGAELTREREHTAQEQAARTLVEERTRIARELHDVVAHSMSVIQVQASTARYRVEGVTDEAAREFDDIAASARSALTEMRRLLGVLRTEDQTAELAPQQGIADIPALVDSIRRAGARVGLEMLGSAEEAPPAVQITTFRITQEALSNAVRHAPGADVAVRIRSGDDSTHIIVRNGAPSDPPTDQGSGHGLRGMRERVTLLGGSLEAGPDAGGGWVVSALLPWTAPPQQ